MKKHMMNDVGVVVFSIVLLGVLSIAALDRTQEAQARQASSYLCSPLNCHAMNPAHWL